MILYDIWFMAVVLLMIRNLWVLRVLWAWGDAVLAYRRRLLHTDMKAYNSLPCNRQMNGAIGNQLVMILKVWCWSVESFFPKKYLGVYREVMGE